MEDIKKAIEGEYLEYLHGTTDEKEFLNNNDLLPFKDAVKACEITASFIFSKWEESERWRKVEEELPECNKDVLVKVTHNEYVHYLVDRYIYHEWQEYYLDGCIIEWKPIH
mgnify:CR=1 FL=1